MHTPRCGGIYNTYCLLVARDLWQRKPTLSLGYTLGLRSVYCHKSKAIVTNNQDILKNSMKMVKIMYDKNSSTHYQRMQDKVKKKWDGSS